MRAEWPRGSGRWLTFPEVDVDRCELFDAWRAREKINPAQAELIDRLQGALSGDAPSWSDKGYAVDSPAAGSGLARSLQVRSSTHLLLRDSRSGRGDVGVAGRAEARDQEAHHHREEELERYGPRVRRVAEHAEEGRPERGEQVTDRLGHTRKRGGVLGVGRPQREERERQAEASPLAET
jgi:hypothetical protein